MFSETATSRNLLLAFGLLICYVVALVTYRLYFSPLARFPGPKIAAMTHLYAMYHDIYRGGKYVWTIENMHKKYGPIVRIRPDAVHINDYLFLDQVYGTTGKRRDKSQLHCNSEMVPASLVATSPHELHRALRAPLNQFFSMKSIRSLEPMLQDCLRKLLARLAQHSSSDIPVTTDFLFSAATNDIVIEYALGHNWNNLDVPDYNKDFLEVMVEGVKMWHISTYYPWVMSLLKSLPVGITLAMMPGAQGMIALSNILEKHINEIRISKNWSGPPTIFEGLLSSSLPEDAKSTDRLLDEARTIMAAGTHTSADAMAKILFHMLSDPKRFRTLKAELTAAIPDVDSMPSMSQVENLPYLNAVIQETLRLHSAGSMRQERIAPDEDLLYTSKDGKAYRIPAGTTMAMTAPLLSRNADLYPAPHSFRPERFLENPHLDAHSLAFSRGPRICLGINLAHAEMQLIMAGVLRKYEIYDGTGAQTCPTLELYETTREDVDMASDWGLAAPRPGSKGVRVRVRDGVVKGA